MLASDLNNPEFANPTNPDAMLYVEFYWHEPIDKWASEEESMRQGKRVVVKRAKQPYVRIMKPGDQTTIIETAVREDHKQRWPEKWLYFQMAEGMIDEGQGIPGWKLEEWPYLEDKPTLIRELKFARFYTVDQVAGASDAQVQRLGVGGQGLREQARVDLRNKVGADVRNEIARKDAEIAEMKERMARLEALVMQGKPAVEEEAPHEEPVDQERAQLAQQYVEKFGRRPHHKLSLERLRAELNG